MNPARGPWIIGRLRAALMVAVAVAAVADLVTFVSLVVGGGDAGVDERADRPGPDTVAREVIQAVADDDCDDLDDLVAADADLPEAVVRCRAGVVRTVDLTDVRVEATTTDGDDSSVTVGVAADGADSRVVVELRLEGDRWRVTGVRPA